MTSKPALMNLTTAEAFYKLFCAFPKKERIAIAHFIFADKVIRQELGLTEIPNEITLQSFSEDKANMPVFNTIDELRQDLLA